MSRPTTFELLHEPRLLVVLAGASSVGTRTVSALERAVMPNLSALASRGRAGRLRAVAPHLPVDEVSAHATLLGTALPEPLDPGAVAAEALGVMVEPGERFTLVDVLDHAGEPAPALHVGRAVEVLRARLPGHRVAAVRRGHQVLLAGAPDPVLPEVDGLELRAEPPGWLPERPPLDARTVVVAAGGAGIVGVARLLGAATVVVDGLRAAGPDPVPVRLRDAATRALLGGAGTVVVETSAPLVARRGQRDERARERAVADALGQLDRELIGPLRTTAAWRGAGFVVTSDLARQSAGPPTRGEVPILVAGGRDPMGAARPRPTSEGGLVPPAYTERGVADRPIVTSPFTIPPLRDPEAPLRFARDVRTGVTMPVPVD